MTASVRYRWPLYAGQLNSKYKGRFLRRCSVTVIHRVTAIYRAVIYRFDCSLWMTSELKKEVRDGPYC